MQHTRSSEIRVPARGCNHTAYQDTQSDNEGEVGERGQGSHSLTSGLGYRVYSKSGLRMLAEYPNIICTQHPIIILLSECCSQKVGGVDAYGGLRLEVLPGLTPSGSRWSRGTVDWHASVGGLTRWQACSRKLHPRKDGGGEEVKEGREE